MGEVAVALAGVLVAALGALWWRARGEARRLQSRLEVASSDLQRLEVTFSRFAPQQVVDRIAAGGVATTPEKKEVTVLFADLIGFTEMSERLDPADLVKILNGYFARMSRVVADQRGHVAKFIGDGMMALFGALERNPWQARDAVRAALAMHTELEAYNRELRSAGMPELRVGIGIHRGVAVAGVIGSHELLEFTVIGSTVNLASRLEELTRAHDAGIVISEAVQQGLDSRFIVRELPTMPIRGIAEPVRTFAVDGLE